MACRIGMSTEANRCVREPKEGGIVSETTTRCILHRNRIHGEAHAKEVPERRVTDMAPIPAPDVHQPGTDPARKLSPPLRSPSIWRQGLCRILKPVSTGSRWRAGITSRLARRRLPTPPANWWTGSACTADRGPPPGGCPPERVSRPRHPPASAGLFALRDGSVSRVQSDCLCDGSCQACQAIGNCLVRYKTGGPQAALPLVSVRSWSHKHSGSYEPGRVTDFMR